MPSNPIVLGEDEQRRRTLTGGRRARTGWARFTFAGHISRFNYCCRIWSIGAVQRGESSVSIVKSRLINFSTTDGAGVRYFRAECLKSRPKKKENEKNTIKNYINEKRLIIKTGVVIHLVPDTRNEK